MGVRNCGARARRSASPVTSASARPCAARTRKTWSWGARHTGEARWRAGKLTTSANGRYSASSASRSDASRWNLGKVNTRRSSSTVSRQTSGTTRPRRHASPNQATCSSGQSSADTAENQRAKPMVICGRAGEPGYSPPAAIQSSTPAGALRAPRRNPSYVDANNRPVSSIVTGCNS